MPKLKAPPMTQTPLPTKFIYMAATIDMTMASIPTTKRPRMANPGLAELFFPFSLLVKLAFLSYWLSIGHVFGGLTIKCPHRRNLNP